MIKSNYIYLLFLFFISLLCVSNSKGIASFDLDAKLPNVDLCYSFENQHISNTTKRNTLKIISWNIQDLGQSKDATEIDFIVNILKEFDIIAIQEVVAKHPSGAQKVAQIVDELNRKGSKWDYRISNPTKSPSVYISERYAFIWKTSKLDIKGRAYLDSELASEIFREPFIANFKFKSKNEIFTVVNFHSRKYSDKPELEIPYFNFYQKRLNTDKLLIAGDFNLNEKHTVWKELYQQGFKAAVENTRTTLKRTCPKGNYLSHEIDNIYYSKEIKFINSGVVDYVEACENLEAARMISDHLPVSLEFSFKE